MKINMLLLGLCILLMSCGSNSKDDSSTKEDVDPIFAEACECLDLANTLQSEFSKVTSSDEQLEVQKAYQDQIDACDKVIDVYSDGFKGLNKEETKIRKQKMGSVCPAYKDIPK